MNCVFKQTQRLRNKGIFENFSIAKVSNFNEIFRLKGRFYLDLYERNYQNYCFIGSLTLSLILKISRY